MSQCLEIDVVPAFFSRNHFVAKGKSMIGGKDLSTHCSGRKKLTWDEDYRGSLSLLKTMLKIPKC